MAQSRPKVAFDWREPAEEEIRSAGRVELRPIQGAQLAKPVRSRGRRVGLALTALAGLAGLAAASYFGGVLLIASAIAALFVLSVAWGVWILNNVHFS